VLAAELHPVRLALAQGDPDDRRDRLVEATGGGGVARAQPEVVDQAEVGADIAVVDGLRAVAVRVEDEGTVVVRPVLRSRAGSAGVGVARSGQLLPERLDARAPVP
jgi:hypothetical protein